MNDRSADLVDDLKVWAERSRRQTIKLRGYDGATAALCDRAVAEIERLRHRAQMAQASALGANREAGRQYRYSRIVESYLDRETLKEVLRQYRQSPDGSAVEVRS